MIVGDKVKIRLNSRTIKNYIKKGYDGNVGCEIEVKIEDLTKGSHVIINTKCDICGGEKLQMYKTYNNCIDLSDEYRCFSCARKVSQKTCIVRYGGVSPMCSKNVLKKREQGLNMNESKKKSCLDKGYNFIFIINKYYTELDNIINFPSF